MGLFGGVDFRENRRKKKKRKENGERNKFIRVFWLSEFVEGKLVGPK